MMRIQYVSEAHSSEDSEVVRVLILGQQSAQVLGSLYIMRESQARYIFTSGNERVNIMEIQVDRMLVILEVRRRERKTTKDTSYKEY